MDGPARVAGNQASPPERAHPSDFLSQGVMVEIVNSIEGKKGTEHVLYSETEQKIQVVGENYRGDVFDRLRAKYQPAPREEIDVWFSGVLLPEPTNPYDNHALMVILLDPDQDSQLVTPLHIGYLDREHAARAEPRIIKLWNQGKVIPLSLKIRGGTTQNRTYQITGFAMTSEIQF